VPDHQATNCALCKIEFTNSPEDLIAEKAKATAAAMHAADQQDFYKHHCRACGQIVCNLCSLKRRAVPERGWTSDVRVCNDCMTVK
jgi:FYVE zinc finger